MSESIIHESVANQITNLASLADAPCEYFQHVVFDSVVAYTAPVEDTLFNITVPANTALVITSLEILTLYNTADAALPSDFRSTDNLNPYGPYVGAGAVGQIRFLLNGLEQIFATAFDFGVINQGILFVINGNKSIVIKANPFTPVGKNVTLVSRLNTFVVVPEAAVTETLKKKETRIITGVVSSA